MIVIDLAGIVNAIALVLSVPLGLGGLLLVYLADDASTFFWGLVSAALAVGMWVR
jgi:hypothetical protein